MRGLHSLLIAQPNAPTSAYCVIHTGVSRQTFWTMMRAIALTSAPISTHDMGKSSESMVAFERFSKVRTIIFHFMKSAVRPPATIMPVAGHITHMSTLRRVIASTTPNFIRRPGAKYQEISVPMSMLKLMRMPTSMPEPSESRLQLTPNAIASPLAPMPVISGMRYQCGASRRASSRMTMEAADSTVPTPMDVALARASGPRESSTISVSAAATPSAYVSFSSMTKCWRIGTARNTPSRPAVVSHKNEVMGVSTILKLRLGSMRSMSKAAMSTQRNAVWPAEVPHVCTMLFSQRL